MDTFDKLVDQFLTEFNVEDRNDPAFYDYAVIFVQQLKQRNMIPPGADVRKTAMQIVKDQYYNYIDINDNVSYKVSFLFNTSIKDDSPHNLKVEINNLLNDEPPKVIESTHEEESIDEIVSFLDKVSRDAEAEAGKVPGEDVPAEVGETPSEMPGAKSPQFDQGGAPGFNTPSQASNTPQQAPSTSQYLKGL
jgi:hypothetical protein